jgi:hypothetical protein
VRLLGVKLRIVAAFLFAVFTIGMTPRVGSAAEPTWRVGLARVKITPNEPMPMCGYGPRISEGVLDDLRAKAMALQSPDGCLPSDNRG